MRVICAWCPALIQDGPPPPAPVSHGICSACYTRVLQGGTQDAARAAREGGGMNTMVMVGLAVVGGVVLIWPSPFARISQGW